MTVAKRARPAPCQATETTYADYRPAVRRCTGLIGDGVQCGVWWLTPSPAIRLCRACSKQVGVVRGRMSGAELKACRG